MEVTLIDEERQRFARRLRERDADNERLRAALQEAQTLSKGLTGGAVLAQLWSVLDRALEPKP